jgi:hypothetical protein
VRTEAARVSVRLASDDEQVRVDEVAMLITMLDGCTGRLQRFTPPKIDIDPPEPPEPPERPDPVKWER